MSNSIKKLLFLSALIFVSALSFAQSDVQKIQIEVVPHKSNKNIFGEEEVALPSFESSPRRKSPMEEMSEFNKQNNSSEQLQRMIASKNQERANQIQMENQERTNQIQMKNQELELQIKHKQFELDRQMAEKNYELDQQKTYALVGISLLAVIGCFIFFMRRKK